MRQQGGTLGYLEEVRKHLSRLPSIDPTTRTLLVCGYPNVGKSSFMNKVTRAEVDVQPYAFTTKSLFVGHMDYRYIRWQVIDTPGILDHPLEQRNRIEMQAITAMAHLHCAVLYFIDVSEECGFTLEQQLALFDNIKPVFTGKPLLIVANKIDAKPWEAVDQQYRDRIDALVKANHATFIKMSNFTEEGVMTVKSTACDQLLAMRIQKKHRTNKVAGIANRMHVTVPKPRDNKTRGVTIPERVLRKRREAEAARLAAGGMSREELANDLARGRRMTRLVESSRKVEDDEDDDASMDGKAKLLRDVEAANGGAGVFRFDWREHRLLKNDDWKFVRGAALVCVILQVHHKCSCGVSVRFLTHACAFVFVFLSFLSFRTSSQKSWMARTLPILCPETSRRVCWSWSALRRKTCDGWRLRRQKKRAESAKTTQTCDALPTPSVTRSNSARSAAVKSATRTGHHFHTSTRPWMRRTCVTTWSLLACAATGLCPVPWSVVAVSNASAVACTNPMAAPRKSVRPARLCVGLYRWLPSRVMACGIWASARRRLGMHAKPRRSSPNSVCRARAIGLSAPRCPVISSVASVALARPIADRGFRCCSLSMRCIADASAPPLFLFCCCCGCRVAMSHLVLVPREEQTANARCVLWGSLFFRLDARAYRVAVLCGKLEGKKERKTPLALHLLCCVKHITSASAKQDLGQTPGRYCGHVDFQPCARWISFAQIPVGM